MPTMKTPYRVINPPEYVSKYLEKARKIRNQNWSALFDAFQAGDQRKVRKLRDAYFKNDAHKAAYLFQAGVRWPNVSSWETEVAGFDPLHPMQHVVDWWRQPKIGDGFRYVCDLSAHLKAAHMMAADVVRAQMNVPCFIYNVKRSHRFADGTGRGALVQRLLAQLRAGFVHYRIYDARDCFNSISPGALIPPNLPLPWRIYENTLNLENLSFRHDTVRERRHFADITFYRDIVNAEGASGPDGLMQGSPSSNVILAYLLQHAPQPDPQDGCILLYGDDLIALSRTPTIASRVDRAVTQFFEQPTLGPLQLHRRASGHLGSFEYLGYEFIYSEVEDDWQVNLSSRNWNNLVRIRNGEALKHWPMHGPWVDRQIAHRIAKSLEGHNALTDPVAILETIVLGGWDILEIASAASGRI
ncbi:hypothetical protein [uncultured Roseovarius sp.]|uniref:hypothetical protein n=1 Tax=uncultured Roseovarius sp. TaxID=293344 RepID=UPI00262E77F5|nr:hypothetical protein [uncultured Roseovarius sp.]